MKEDIQLLIENTRGKRDMLAVFISAIEKIPSPKEKNISLHQGGHFIDVYNNSFDNHCDDGLYSS